MIFNQKKRTEAIKYLNDLFNLDKSVCIKIYRKIRSISQNNLFWLWMACVEENTGNDSMWLHDYYCQKHLAPTELKIKTPLGTKIIYTMTGTSGLDTLRFTTFLDKVKMDAEEEFTTDKEHPFKLPVPGDLIFAQFVEHYSQFL
jgi:hypothetical protein